MSKKPSPDSLPAKSCDLETALGEHSFLRGFTPHQLQILSDSAMFTEFKAGEIIFGQGDPANRFYLIRRGKINLESHLQSGGTVLIQTVGQGDVLGWSWLFEPYFWQFDARAVEPTQAIFFYATPLREECECDPALGYELFRRVAKVVVNRLQATRRKLIELQERCDEGN